MMKIYISLLSAYIARDHACGLFCTGCLQSYLPRPSSRVVDHTTEFPWQPELDQLEKWARTGAPGRQEASEAGSNFKQPASLNSMELHAGGDWWRKLKSAGRTRVGRYILPLRAGRGPVSPTAHSIQMFKQLVFCNWRRFVSLCWKYCLWKENKRISAADLLSYFSNSH